MNTLALAFIIATKAFNLSPGLLSAVCWVESNHKVGAINVDDGGSSSHGACQMKLATARWMGYKGSARMLRINAHVNAYYAAKFIRFQLDRYDGDVRKAVAAYNSGTYRENKRGLTMNRRYVSKVFKAWAEDR